MRHTPASPRSGFFTVAALVAVLLVWPTAANAQLGGQTSIDPRVLALEIKCNKLEDTINKLEGAVGNLLTLLTCVSRQEGVINGVSGPTCSSRAATSTSAAARVRRTTPPTSAT